MMSRPAPKHAPRVPFALLLVGLVVGGLAALLALNTASAANELRRHDLAARDTGVSAQLEQLRNEIAASQAPNNLAKVAGQLGMVPAANPAFLEIGADGSVKVLGSPAAASAPPAAPTQTPHPHRHPHPHTSATTKVAASSKSASTTASKTASRAGSKTASTTKSTSSATNSKAAHHPATPGGAPSSPQPSATTTLPGGTR